MSPPGDRIEVVARLSRDGLALPVISDHFDRLGVVGVFLRGTLAEVVAGAVAQPSLWQESDEDAEGAIGIGPLTQRTRHGDEVDRGVPLGAVLVLVEDPDVAHVRARQPGDLDVGRVAWIEHRSPSTPLRGPDGRLQRAYPLVDRGIGRSHHATVHAGRFGTHAGTPTPLRGLRSTGPDHGSRIAWVRGRRYCLDRGPGRGDRLRPRRVGPGPGVPWPRPARRRRTASALPTAELRRRRAPARRTLRHGGGP